MKSTLAVAVLLLSAGIASANPNHARPNAATHGDWCYEPSTYMDYEQGLALGKQQLAEQQIPAKPLGDVARELRAKKSQSQQTVQPTSSGSASLHTTLFN
jgi:hypothetical protein